MSVLLWENRGSSAMTFTINVYFYTAGSDGVRKPLAQGTVTGTSYSDITTQCDTMANDMQGRYTFVWD